MQTIQPDEFFAKSNVTHGRRDRIIDEILELKESRLSNHEVIEQLNRGNYTADEKIYAVYELGRLSQANSGPAEKEFPLIGAEGTTSFEIPVEEAERLGMRYAKHQVLVATFDAEQGTIMFTGWGRDPLQAEKVDGAINALQMYLHDQGMIEVPAAPTQDEVVPGMSILKDA